MGRFGRFNPRQKRDRKGRWTKGGGSSGGGSSRTKNRTRAGLLKDPRTKFARKGAAAGAVAGGLAASWTTFNPNAILKGAQIGAIAGAVVGGRADHLAYLKRAKQKQRASKKR